MAKRLHVANLSSETTEAELLALFSGIGRVASASIATDVTTGASRGSGSVEMISEDEAQSAVEILNGHVLNGSKIHVGEIRLPSANGKPVQAPAPKRTSKAKTTKRAAS
jgi:RNA recognition motif-containing protein